MGDCQDDSILIKIIIPMGVPLSSIYSRREALMGIPFRGTLMAIARNQYAGLHVANQVVVRLSAGMRAGMAGGPGPP